MTRRTGKSRVTKKKKDRPLRTVPCREHVQHVERWCDHHQRWERVS